jgi:para-nitrobenzyl esterase
MKRFAAIALVCAWALGCGRGRGLPELAGTGWQLVEIQSMDGAVMRPDDGAKYTLNFGAGGVEVRLDCNRGSGPWASTTPGQLVFGPLAITRETCPPGSLGARIARDLGFVRSYLQRDGRLYVSLMADGGIYVFEKLGTPQAPRAEVTPRTLVAGRERVPR